jgi:CspA family cold shock protein
MTDYGFVAQIFTEIQGMAPGIVKWFNDSKGFRTLVEGRRVSFDITTGPKGKQASNIQIA